MLASDAVIAGVLSALDWLARMRPHECEGSPRRPSARSINGTYFNGDMAVRPWMAAGARVVGLVHELQRSLSLFTPS